MSVLLFQSGLSVSVAVENPFEGIHAYNSDRDKAAKAAKEKWGKINLTEIIEAEKANLLLLESKRQEVIQNFHLFQRDRWIRSTIDTGEQTLLPFFFDTTLKKMFVDICGKEADSFISKNYPRTELWKVWADKLQQDSSDRVGAAGRDFKEKWGFLPPPFPKNADDDPLPENFLDLERKAPAYWAKNLKAIEKALTISGGGFAHSYEDYLAKSPIKLLKDFDDEKTLPRKLADRIVKGRTDQAKIEDEIKGLTARLKELNDLKTPPKTGKKKTDSEEDEKTPEEMRKERAAKVEKVLGKLKEKGAFGEEAEAEEKLKVLEGVLGSLQGKAGESTDPKVKEAVGVAEGYTKIFGEVEAYKKLKDENVLASVILEIQITERELEFYREKTALEKKRLASLQQELDSQCAALRKLEDACESRLLICEGFRKWVIGEIKEAGEGELLDGEFSDFNKDFSKFKRDYKSPAASDPSLAIYEQHLGALFKKLKKEENLKKRLTGEAPWDLGVSVVLNDKSIPMSCRKEMFKALLIGASIIAVDFSESEIASKQELWISLRLESMKSANALKSWKTLIDWEVGLIADYHASGIKTDEVAKLVVEALGLAAIAWRL